MSEQGDIEVTKYYSTAGFRTIDQCCEFLSGRYPGGWRFVPSYETVEGLFRDKDIRGVNRTIVVIATSRMATPNPTLPSRREGAPQKQFTWINPEKFDNLYRFCEFLDRRYPQGWRFTKRWRDLDGHLIEGSAFIGSHYIVPDFYSQDNISAIEVDITNFSTKAINPPPHTQERDTPMQQIPVKQVYWQTAIIYVDPETKQVTEIQPPEQILGTTRAVVERTLAISLADNNEFNTPEKLADVHFLIQPMFSDQFGLH